MTDLDYVLIIISEGEEDATAPYVHSVRFATSTAAKEAMKLLQPLRCIRNVFLVEDTWRGG